MKPLIWGLPGSKEQTNNNYTPFSFSIVGHLAKEVTIVKKTSERSVLFPVFFFVSLACITVILLASCEPQSLSGGWQNAGLVTDDPPALTTASPGTTGVSATTLPPVTTAPATTVPPVTTAPPVLYYDPLTGLPCQSGEAGRRPLAFCVKSAKPSEIGAADLVIEAATESKTTRLSLIGTAHTSIFNTVDIASTRPYLATLTNDFFGISVFRGTSDNSFPATDFLFDTLDLSEKSLNSSDELLALLREAGYQTSVAGSIALPYRLADVGSTVSPEALRSSYVSISFHREAATTFTYDTVRGAYTMRTSAALTSVTGELPTFKNLLVLFHDATKRVTKDGVELSLDSTIGGQGYYLTNGGAIPIFWRRDPVTSSLRLTDTDGVELTVNRGKTYLAMTTYEYRESMIMN